MCTHLSADSLESTVELGTVPLRYDGLVVHPVRPFVSPVKEVDGVKESIPIGWEGIVYVITVLSIWRV